jgi:hypothetical protein
MTMRAIWTCSLLVVLAGTGRAPGPVRQEAWRTSLLTAREAVWRDYFSKPDKLAAVLTPDFIAMNEGGPPWQTRDEVIAGSRRAVERGLSLVKLEFPRTDIQRYADVAIVYTTYEMHLARAGEAASVEKGQATEVFRWDGKVWLHTGWHLAQVR